MVDIVEFVAANAMAVAPWFVASIGIGVTVRALRLADGLRAALGRRPLQAVMLAAVVGAFAPFCSCTVVPVVAGMLVAGVPLAPVMAFWLASPTMDPEIFTFTVAMLGWDLAVVRLVAAVALSVGGGLGVHLLTRAGRLTAPLRAATSSSSCGAPDGVCAVSAPVVEAVGGGGGGSGVVLADAPARPGVLSRIRSLEIRPLLSEIARESWSLGRWLLLAFVVEALIVAYVPQGQIVTVLGADSGWAVPLAALVGVPLYVSNLTALPVVSGLLAQGMAPGAAIAFLLAGPVTTVPAMMAVRPLVRDGVFAYYLGISLAGAVVLGWVSGYALG